MCALRQVRQGIRGYANCKCGGILDIIYDYDYIKANLTKDKLKSRPKVGESPIAITPLDELPT